VIARSGIWERAVLEARVPLRTYITPAERAGPWPETVITALTIAALAAAARRAPRGRAAGDRGEHVGDRGPTAGKGLRAR
jgi:apolipoprotein N-acyltransferase